MVYVRAHLIRIAFFDYVHTSLIGNPELFLYLFVKLPMKSDKRAHCFSL